MLINSSRLTNCPILSLHVGGPIGRVAEMIVDPDSLKIIACKVEGPLVGKETGDILPMSSIREFSQLGMIVDSTDEFVEADEIIRVKEVLDLNFELVGLKVETQKKTKLGKVSDYTIEPESWQVQQLIVQRPTLKSFFDPELVISRQQIIEVDDYRVVVKDQTRSAKSEVPTEFVPSFINPFREAELASEAQADEPSVEPHED